MVTRKASLTPADLTWDRFIYPRGNRSQQTVSTYVEALDIGAKFPPIKVQRVFNYTDEYGNGTPEGIVTIIIDGIHRWSAFKEKGQAKQPLPYHPLQKRNMKLFLRIFSPWPMKTQNL